MKIIRRYWLAFLARRFPFAFARWVNRERCSIKIHNDADGYWMVKIGALSAFRRRNLGEAMWFALGACEREPGWQWTSDYLRTLSKADLKPEPIDGRTWEELPK